MTYTDKLQYNLRWDKQGAQLKSEAQLGSVLAFSIAISPFAFNVPALWNFRARSTCRSPTRFLFPGFIRCGINSRFAMTLSSSGATDRGMMWSTEGG